MRFTKVETMPKLGRKASALKMELIEFINMDVKCVKVTLAPGEYSCSNSAQSTIQNAIKRYGFPITVRCRKGELYLIRTDM